MPEEKRTCDSIMLWLKEQEENRHPISPHLWMEAAQALNVLISDENDKLITLNSQVAEARAACRAGTRSAVDAKIALEVLPVFAERERQSRKIDQIKESIRLAKTSARIKSEEMRNQL